MLGDDSEMKFIHNLQSHQQNCGVIKFLLNGEWNAWFVRWAYFQEMISKASEKIK